jgi:hypothetical protein
MPRVESALLLQICLLNIDYALQLVQFKPMLSSVKWHHRNRYREMTRIRERGTQGLGRGVTCVKLVWILRLLSKRDWQVNEKDRVAI